MKKINSKILSLFLSVALIFSFSFPIFAHAATFSNMSDTLTSQAPGAMADHTFTWTQGVGHAVTAGDTIAIAFSSDYFTANAAGSWQTLDFAFTDNHHTAQAPLAVGASPSCTSSDNYTVTIAGTAPPTFTITFCSGWITSSTGSAITFKIFGTTAVGTGTLTNRGTQFDSAPITITDTGSNTDSGILAVAVDTNDVVTVTATVNPILTFDIGSNSLALGVLSSAASSASSTTIAVSSNAAGGFVVMYNGPTLTSASSTISAYSTPSASTPGTAGFGINLALNTSPSIGASAVGTGCASGIQSDYATANQFTWKSSTSTTIATVTSPSTCTYTVSYVANISTVTPAGNYSSAATYLATGTF